MDTSLRNEQGGWRLLLSLGCFLAAVSSGACRAGCAGSRATQGEPATLLRRVAGLPDATPIAVDIDGPHGLFLVAGSRGPIQVWSEAGIGATSVASIPVTGALLAASFFGQGAVFFAQEQGLATVWTWSDRRALFTHDFASRARRAAISPDGRYVAFGGAVVDVASNREVGEAKPIASQSALGFSAGGARVVSAGFQEPWIVVRDLPSGVAREWLAPDKVSHVVLNPGGDLVSASMNDGTLHSWRQPSGESLAIWQGPKEIRALCFTSQASDIVVADPQGLSVVDVTTARRAWRVDLEGTLWVVACDGGLVAAGTTDGSLWLWDVSRHVLRARLRLSSAAIVALHLSAVGHRLAAADEKGEAAIWSWR
jgi:WD40 repeat protein